MMPLLADVYDALEPELYALAGRVVEQALRMDTLGVHPQAQYLVESAQVISKQPLQRDRRPLLPAVATAIEPALFYIHLLNDNLTGFMTGEIAGQRIVKAAGSPAWVDYNHRFPGTAVLADLVRDLAGPLIPNRDVLEVGGGTGATTMRLGPVLREARSFTFSDVKQGFLDRALAYVQPNTPLTTVLFDVNKLGPTEPRYDLIYATNVLHVAKDIHKVMYWLRDSLRPGGYLVLGEGSPYSVGGRWPLDLVFSLFPAWWDIPRSAIRPHPGFIVPAGWRSIGWGAGYRLQMLLTLEDDTRLFGSAQVWQKE